MFFYTLLHIKEASEWCTISLHDRHDPNINAITIRWAISAEMRHKFGISQDDQHIMSIEFREKIKQTFVTCP